MTSLAGILTSIFLMSFVCAPAHANTLFTREKHLLDAHTLVIDSGENAPVQTLQFGNFDNSQISFDAIEKAFTVHSNLILSGALTNKGAAVFEDTVTFSETSSLSGFLHADILDDAGSFTSTYLQNATSGSTTTFSDLLQAIDEGLNNPKSSSSGLDWETPTPVGTYTTLSGGTNSLSGLVDEIDTTLTSFSSSLADVVSLSTSLSGSVDTLQTSQAQTQETVDSILLGNESVGFSGVNPLFGTQDTISGALEALAEWIDINQSDISTIEAELYDMNTQDSSTTWTGLIDAGSFSVLNGGAQSLSGLIHDIDRNLEDISTNLSNPLILSGGRYILSDLVTEVDDLFFQLASDISFNQHDIAHIITDIYDLQDDISTLSLSGTAAESSSNITGLSFLPNGEYTLSSLATQIDTLLDDHEFRISALESELASGSTNWSGDIEVGTLQFLSGGTNSLSGLIGEIDTTLSSHALSLLTLSNTTASLSGSIDTLQDSHNSLQQVFDALDVSIGSSWNDSFSVGSLSTLSGGTNSLSNLISEIDASLLALESSQGSSGLSWTGALDVGQMTVLSGGVVSLSGVIHSADNALQAQAQGLSDLHLQLNSIEINSGYTWGGPLYVGAMEYLSGGLTSLSGMIYEIDESLNDLALDIAANETTLSDVIVDVSTLESDVTGLNVDVSDLQSLYTGLETDVTSLGNAVNSLWTGSFDAGAFTLLNGGITSFSGILNEVDTTLVQHNIDIIDLQNDVDTLELSIDSSWGTEFNVGTFSLLSGSSNSLSGLIHQIDSTLSDLTLDVAANETTLSDVIVDVSTLESDVTGLNVDVSDLQSLYTGLETDVTSLGNAVNSLWTGSFDAGAFTLLNGGITSFSGILNEVDTTLVQHNIDIIDLQNDVDTLELSIDSSWGTEFNVGTFSLLSGSSNSLSGLIHQIDSTLSDLTLDVAANETTLSDVIVDVDSNSTDILANQLAISDLQTLTATLNSDPYISYISHYPSYAHSIASTTSSGMLSNLSTQYGNSYRWLSQTSLAPQVATITINSRLPDDFVSFNGSNPFDFRIQTSNTSSAITSVDFEVTNLTTSQDYVFATLSNLDLTSSSSNVIINHSPALSIGSGSAGDVIETTFTLTIDGSLESISLFDYTMSYIGQ